MKVCFVTNGCLDYRLPVFTSLSSCHDVFFVFTSPHCFNADKLSYEIRLTSISYLKSLLKREYDVLISGFPTWLTWFEFIISKLRRKKLIFWVEEWYSPSTVTRKLTTPFLKLMVRKCDAVVVSGLAARSHVLNYGASPDKIFVSPNASIIGTCEDAYSGVISDIDDNKPFTILYLGRLVKYKGADYLLKAFSRLTKKYRNTRLVIAGRGSYEIYLKQLAKKLKISNIDFVYIDSDKEKIACYKESDVFVLPSVWQPDYCEAWGLVINEAMQFGKAIITTDAVGAAPDLVRNGTNGFIVKNADSEALYVVLDRLAKNPQLAKRMGCESKRIIGQYTYERMVSGFNNALSYVYCK